MPRRYIMEHRWFFSRGGGGVKVFMKHLHHYGCDSKIHKVGRLDTCIKDMLIFGGHSVYQRELRSDLTWSKAERGLGLQNQEYQRCRNLDKNNHDVVRSLLSKLRVLFRVRDCLDALSIGVGLWESPQKSCLNFVIVTYIISMSK